MEIQRGTAEVNGTSVHYEIAGSGTPLVLIHGFALDVRMWDDQIEAFTATNRVIRYDLRGFGQSRSPEGSYSHADDLRGLLSYLSIDTAAILGLSLGGGVAIDFALAYPELTRSLILVDGMVDGWAWSSEWNEQAGSVWMAGRESGVAAARDRWLGLPLFAAAQRQPKVARCLSQMVSDYSGWHWCHDDPHQGLQPAAMQRLGDIAAPTLIIIGEWDAPDFRSMAEAFERSISGGRKAIMNGVGHLANMEDPETFNAIVRQFLEDH